MLQAQWCAQNTRQNNLRFLHRTATYGSHPYYRRTVISIWHFDLVMCIIWDSPSNIRRSLQIKLKLIVQLSMCSRFKSSVTLQLMNDQHGVFNLVINASQLWDKIMLGFNLGCIWMQIQLSVPLQEGNRAIKKQLYSWLFLFERNSFFYLLVRTQHRILFANISDKR